MPPLPAHMSAFSLHVRSGHLRIAAIRQMKCEDETHAG